MKKIQYVYGFGRPIYWLQSKFQCRNPQISKLLTEIALKSYTVKKANVDKQRQIADVSERISQKLLKKSKNLTGL